MFQPATRWFRQWFQTIPFLRTGLAYLAAVNAAPNGLSSLDSPSYEVWRDRFLLVRLRLALGLALAIWLSFLVLPVGRSLIRKDALDLENIIVGVLVTLTLALTWRLSQTEWGVTHLRMLFFGFVGSLQMLPQTIDAVAGNIRASGTPDLYVWIFTFFTQATLVPVRWRLHVASQLLVVGYSFALREWAGLSFRTSAAQSRTGTLLAVFWIFVVCDLSVFLYERLQRAEFQARHDLALANRHLATAEAEVRKALNAEKELSQMKSRFVSMTSHEFRTPLTTILSSSEALEHYGDRWSPDKRKTYFQRIRATVRHMNDLLEAVLVIGRADSGRLVPEPVPIDLVEFCETLVEEFRLSLRPDLALDLQVILPSMATKPETIADDRLLRQIFGNLLANAIKYSPQGGQIDFLIEYRAEGDVLFQVSDRGIGIPQADLPYLFESFHRAGNVGTLPGTGLGLAIVNRAVEACGGSIAVKSQENVGTTFEVILPLIHPGA